MDIKRICYYLESILNVPIHEVSISKLNEDTELAVQVGGVPYILTCKAEELRIKKVSVQSVENGSCYGVVSDNADRLYFIGPVQFSQRNVKNMDKYGYYCEVQVFMESLLMIYEYLTGEEMSFSQFLTNGEMEDYQKSMNEEMSQYHFRQQENQRLHNSYVQERREQNAIREGNIEKFYHAVDEPLIGQIGINSEDRLRSVKNNAITLMGLSTRSAIEGGLNPETGFQLCDNYISQIEKMKDVNKIIHFSRCAQEELIRRVAMVHKVKGNTKSPYTERCKSYIYKHMHETISVGRMADEIGVTENYLSMLFRRDEGITMKEYILREKMYYAKNLLIYSMYSLNDIAQYFGFSSQSHFGNVFRKYTGMTPLEYRKQNRAENFMEDFSWRVDIEKEM